MRIILRYATALAFSVVGLSAQEATVVSLPHHRGEAVAPDSTYQGIAATSVTVSLGGPTGVQPCFNCVPGTTGSATIGDPRYLLDFGKGRTTVFVTLLIEDTDYTGPCTGVYVLLQDNVTNLSGKQAISGGCAAGTDYIVYWSPSFLSQGSGTSGLLKGGVSIAAGSVASAVEQPLQMSAFPPPSGVIGPTTITIGAPEAGLPCYGCAPSWGTAPSLSIPTPMFAVPRGEALMLTMEIQDSTYAGECTFVYQIKQGTTVVVDGSRAASGGCPLPSVHIPTWNITIPADTPTGPAILSGGVKAGNQTFGMYQPILIQ